MHSSSCLCIEQGWSSFQAPVLPSCLISLHFVVFEAYFLLALLQKVKQTWRTVLNETVCHMEDGSSSCLCTQFSFTKTNSKPPQWLMKDPLKGKGSPPSHPFVSKTVAEYKSRKFYSLLKFRSKIIWNVFLKSSLEHSSSNQPKTDQGVHLP